MGTTAVVQLAGTHLELVRHPDDGRVLAFSDSADAFAFAVSLELVQGSSAGTVDAPHGEALHVLASGVTAFDLLTGPVEEAA